MFRHVVLIQFYDEVPQEDRARAIGLLEGLFVLPEVKEYRVGRQIRLAHKFDVAEVAAFESEEAFNAFRARPEHQTLVAIMREIADWETVDFVD